ncbi:MAG: outer membrane beta-barrel protein, partial [Thermonemataceae bacterium]|nr:outer membrane beta-barrel protein [Thermonemataceae bacterium]
MKKITMLFGAMLVCLLSYSNLKAQAVPDSTAAKKGAFAFSGYLDTYYFGNLNNPKSQSNLGASGYERAFEQRSGQFQLGLIQAKGVYTS